jgi:tight adherence protein C
MVETQILLLGLVFLAVSGTVVGLGLVAGRARGLSHRLRGIGAAPGSGADESGEKLRWPDRLARLAAPVAKLGAPANEQRVSRLRQRFLNAGIREPAASSLFLASRLALAVGLPAAYWLVDKTVGLPVSPQLDLAILALLAALGFSLPMMLLSYLVSVRQREILEAFPDALDLIIVCVEAGLGLDMAINKTTEELKLRSPSLARELELVAVELRVGSSRERALRNLALRTGLEEVSSFASMLVQTDKYGASLADALRVHADVLRTRRRLRAEETAAKIPMKLLFPLMFFIFPSLMLVLLGPAFIQISRVL